MKLSLDQVKKVAKLANLPLDSKEEELYSEQLSKILDYIDQLNKVDTKNTEPTFNVTGLSNVTRRDETEESLSEEASLKNSSNTKNKFFITKGIFEE